MAKHVANNDIIINALYRNEEGCFDDLNNEGLIPIERRWLQNTLGTGAKFGNHVPLFRAVVALNRAD